MADQLGSTGLPEQHASRLARMGEKLFALPPLEREVGNCENRDDRADAD